MCPRPSLKRDLAPTLAPRSPRCRMVPKALQPFRSCSTSAQDSCLLVSGLCAVSLDPRGLVSKLEEPVACAATSSASAPPCPHPQPSSSQHADYSEHRPSPGGHPNGGEAHVLLHVVVHKVPQFLPGPKLLPSSRTTFCELLESNTRSKANCPCIQVPVLRHSICSRGMKITHFAYSTHSSVILHESECDRAACSVPPRWLGFRSRTPGATFTHSRSTTSTRPLP